MCSVWLWHEDEGPGGACPSANLLVVVCDQVPMAGGWSSKWLSGWKIPTNEPTEDKDRLVSNRARSHPLKLDHSLRSDEDANNEMAGLDAQQ